MLPASLFISDLIHEKTVALPDGSEHVLHFKELPAVEFIKFSRLAQEGSEDARAGASAKLIAASLCEADGKPAMKYEQALKLRTPALNALFAAVMEINGDKPGNPLPSAENDGSGTSSPSRSAKP